MPEVPFRRRVVEIIADLGPNATPRRRYGSGCIVAGRNVLTAAHVVVGAQQVSVRGPDKIKRLASLNPALVGSPDGIDGPDLALLEIIDEVEELAAIPLAAVDRDGPTGEVIEYCAAVGYPAFSERNEPRGARPEAEVEQADGFIPVLSQLVRGFLTLQVEQSPRDLPTDQEAFNASPWSGMSGAPVLASGSLVGVVTVHAPRAGPSALTVTPLTALDHNPQYPAWGPGVANSAAWWERLSAPGPDGNTLPRLPRRGNVNHHAGLSASETAVELSPDVIETHRVSFESTGLEPPARWTADELSRITLDRNPSRLSDLLPALQRAVAAKQVMLDIGLGQLELGRLQVIYRRDVGAWPNGASADALLVEAAEAERSEQRRSGSGGLGALARFVIGAAAALSAPPQDNPSLAGWVESLGYQLADAHRHYTDRYCPPAWLLIDLGYEPRLSAIDDSRPGTLPWPTSISWTYTTRQSGTISELTGETIAAGTKEGLADALKTIFAAIPPSWPLLVDLAMPTGLLTEGIEHWPLFPVGDQLESLSDRYQPRLRWSQRRRDLVLHGRCLDRASRASWNTMPKAMMDALLIDERGLKRWIQNDGGHAWLIGCPPTICGSNPLQILLKEGYGFLLWFRHGGDTRQRRLITKAVSRIPVAARRLAIPDEIPGMRDVPVVIWDDPRGRGDFDLPPLVAAEHIPMQHL